MASSDKEIDNINIPEFVLDDLCSRFLINIPTEEKDDMIRICFQIELAHWFYLDFFRQDYDLPSCGMKSFMKILFHRFPFLNKSQQDVNDVFEKWKKYKVKVPVFGAILLDSTLEKCILVQGFHRKVSWGFPKGKVNKEEDGYSCAIREVKEETGFDITDYGNKGEHLDFTMHDHPMRLYIVPNVPLEFKFEPQTREEIKEIKWFSIKDLPTKKDDTTPKQRIGLNPNCFFMVYPFVKPLRKWASIKKRSMPALLYTSSGFISAPYGTLPKNTQPIESDSYLNVAPDEKAAIQKRYEEMLNLSHPLRAHHPENEDKVQKLLAFSNRRSPSPPVEEDFINRLLTGQIQPKAGHGLLSNLQSNNHPASTHSPSLEHDRGNKQTKLTQGQKLSDFHFRSPTWDNFQLNTKELMTSW